MNSNRKDNVDMKGSRKGSADLSDLEIAAINRERNAEHVSFEKKNDSAPSYLIIVFAINPTFILYHYYYYIYYRLVRQELEKRNIYSH